MFNFDLPFYLACPVLERMKRYFNFLSVCVCVLALRFYIFSLKIIKRLSGGKGLKVKNSKGFNAFGENFLFWVVLRGNSKFEVRSIRESSRRLFYARLR